EPVDPEPDKDRVAAILLGLADGLVAPLDRAEAHAADLGARFQVDVKARLLHRVVFVLDRALLAFDAEADDDLEREAGRARQPGVLEVDGGALPGGEGADDLAGERLEGELVVADDDDVDGDVAQSPGGAVEEGALGDQAVVDFGIADLEGGELDAGDV